MDAASKQMTEGRVAVGPGKRRLLETRWEVNAGWWAAIEQLAKQGEAQLAEGATRFVERMQPPRTEKELLLTTLVQHMSENRTRKQELTR